MADGLFTYGTLETVEIPGAGLPNATNNATAKAPLGVLFRYNGNVYRYVKHDPGTAVATLNGMPAYWKALDPPNGTFTVSSDYTDSIGAVNAVAGVYGGVVTATYYTWIQVGGVHNAAILKDGSMAVGARLTGYSTDGSFNYTAAGATVVDQIVGIVIGGIDITNYTAKVLLQNLVW